MDDLTGRIDQLEQQLRSMRRIVNISCGLLIVTLATCATLGNAENKSATFGKSKQPTTLTVHRLTIVDTDGNKRIVLGSKPNGDAGIALFDRQNRLRMEQMTWANRNAGINHFDRTGKKRAGTLTVADGSAGLFLRDIDGIARLTVTTEKDGSSGISHYDRSAKLRITAGTAPNNQGNVFHYDQRGIKRVMTLTTTQGAVVIGVTDRTGTATWVEGSE
jgi:dipeptidyl aminopeptidase/acylaminoacyl peptidase